MQFIERRRAGARRAIRPLPTPRNGGSSFGVPPYGLPSYGVTYVRVTLPQYVQYMISLGFNDKRVIENLETLGEEHQSQQPNLVTGMTAFGEYTRPASQVEMTRTPQFWDDPMLTMQGAAQPVWITDALGKPL